MGGSIPSLSEKSTTIIAEEVCRGDYSAEQFIHTVTLKASGSHPTGGYHVFLRTNPAYVYPPVFTLTHLRPLGVVTQQVTRFLKIIQFENRETLRELTVVDAAGTHQVEIKQVKGDLPEAPTCR